ncbi:MAG: hypothetical protein GX248_04945 [Peptococcaceae bacterium]|nr:hypothetical protein [Peptococcaceae bacterium]
MNIGARTIKTAIAVALSVYISVLFDVGPAIFAAASAVVCMQQSVGKGFRNGLEQIIVNLLAVVVAVVLGLTIPIEYLSMALATVIMILLCTKVLKTPNHIVLGIMSAIFILSSPHEEFSQHVFTRVLAILIGMAIANIINLIISPPHYREALIAKFIELNNFVVQCFVDSVNKYLYLTPGTEEEMSRNQSHYATLLEETEKLFNLLHYEWNVGLFSSKKKHNKHKTEQQLFKEYLNYNRELWQRSQDLLFLAEERRVRRERANAPAISSEFHNIFEMLVNVIFNATTYNSELQKKIKGEEAVIYPAPRVWSKLNALLTEWLENTPNSNFFMHAWLEVSVVTYNIRWFAKESTRLLNWENNDQKTKQT